MTNKMSSIDLIVHFQEESFLFSIQRSILSVDYIHRIISNYYSINMKQFLLEIFDLRFNQYLILDKDYIDELRLNISFQNILSYSTRIRPCFYTQFHHIPTDINFFSSQTSSQIDHSSHFDPAISDHLIIWLDAYISYPQNNRQLKRYFNQMTNVDIPASFSSKFDLDLDIDNLIRMPYFTIEDNQRLNNKKKKRNELIWMFSNVDDCVEFINILSDSEVNIFVITSGRLGRTLVPQISKRRCINSIYVFTCNLLAQSDWAMNYLNKLVMFDHELDLLTRLTKDIANYYANKAFTSEEFSPKTLQYLHWAKKLMIKSNIIDHQTYPTTQLLQIETLIEHTEMYIKEKHTSIDDYILGVQCDEG